METEEKPSAPPIIEENPRINEFPKIIKPFTEKQLLSLYQNDCIRSAHQYTNEFLENEKGLCFADSSLSESLNEYLKCCVTLKISEKRLKTLIDEQEDANGKIWTLREERVENEGVCHDKTKVVAVHRYQVALFNNQKASEASRFMRQMKEEIFENHSLSLYKADRVKRKIDLYLERLCFDAVTNRSQIMTATSILFSFQRKICKDDIFNRECKLWLDFLVRTLLQNSPTFSDRLLLLNHVIRCPPGVGHWAASYIQVPVPEFNSDDDYLNNGALNEMIGLLSVFFAQPKGRREFLREFCLPNSPSQDEENPWVVLDLDGEIEDGLEVFPLRENDYVSILNQFPFEALFRYILKIERGLEVYDPSRFTTTSFFKLFAFGTQFINLLKNGLALFSNPSYRQLSKRLGHIIKHTLEYISDHWENFRQSHRGHPEEEAIVNRIEAEYNNFFLRAIKSIFWSSASSGMWQYLAVVPYGLVKEDVLWHAFALYHFVDDATLKSWTSSELIREKLTDQAFAASFEDTLSGLPDTEVMFLMTTFANMAMARDFDKSYHFVTTVVSQLLSIGFCNDLTADACGKGCRDLIANIARKHPSVISFLIEQFSTQTLLVEADHCPAVYVVRELDFGKWLPQDGDFDKLGSWLTLNSLDSNYSGLSRAIFSQMRWSDSELLPWNRHCQMAVLIINASNKFAPDTIVGNFLQDSVRHVSNIAAKLRRTPEQVFTSWAWEMCSRLHLHRFDRSGNISDIIDIDLEAEELGHAVATKNPLASYVALQTSQMGHLVEDVLERGVGQLALVLSSGHYDHVLECLANVTPLFIDCVDMIFSSSEWIKIVQQIVAVDQTFIKMARDLVVTDFPGPVLKEFVNMIAYQVANFKTFRRTHPNGIALMWIDILTHLPGWNTNKNVLFAVEYCCKVLVSVPNGIEQLKVALKSMDKEMVNSSQGGAFSWLKIGSSNLTSYYTALMSDFPWISLFTLEIEEEREESMEFWRILVKELSENHGLVSLDKCQKKILNEREFPAFVSNLNALPIYKWCQLILDSAVEQPLQVVYAQKFFKYFTAKHEGPRLGRLFFEGVINTHYFGRLLSKFKSIREYYKAAILNDEISPLGDVFQAFILWLEDMFILNETLHIPSLSPKMMPDLLESILNNSKVDFTLIEMPNFEELTQYFNREWKRLHFRGDYKKSESPFCQSERSLDIQKRLGSYDSPVPLPLGAISPSAVIYVCDKWFVDQQIFNANAMPYLTTLLNHARLFDEQRKEYSSLMCNLNDLMANLYKNEDTEIWTKGSCCGVSGPKGQKFECGGSAAICHKFREAKLQATISNKVEEKKAAMSRLIEASTQPIEAGIITATTVIEECVDYIMKMYFRHLSLCPGRAPPPALLHYRQLGIGLFYQLCDHLSEESNACPLMRHLLTCSLERLGQAMIAENPDQCLSLLHRICSMPDCAQFLTAIFTPGCSNSLDFLQMYRNINEMVDASSTVSFTLLSKMTVETWVSQAIQEGHLGLVSQLISILGLAFKRTGHKVSAERQLVHDLHRQHLMSIVKNSGLQHYREVFSLLLTLTDSGTLDPSLWLDISNSHLSIGQLKRSSSEKDLLAIFQELAVKSHLPLDSDTIQDIGPILRNHFNKERRSVGLHGLYNKYRHYVLPLAAYNGLMSVSLLMSTNLSIEDKFNGTLSLFEAWIIPLKEEQRHETAQWIQQFAESHKVLFPWAPGDVDSAAVMLKVFTFSLQLVDKNFTDERNILSRLLEIYCHFFACTTMKDFVLHPVHQHWQTLPWENFAPTEGDLRRLVVVLDTFIPLCHEFLGKIVCQFPWRQISKETLAPYMLHIMVKLSAEPQVRQVGNLMKVMSQDIPENIWKAVGTGVFENLMHWYVMSVDAKVILMEGAHPLDLKILHVLRVASQIDDQDQEAEIKFAKSNIFLRCHIRLLSSCGNKYKNYLAQHENELEKSLREMVDDLGEIVISCHQMYPKECEDLIKSFLTLANSPSVIPSHVIRNINDCWLRMTDVGTAMLFLTPLLNHLSQLVHCPQTVSDLLEDCLEAYFEDRSDYQNGVKVSWEQILPLVALPKDKDKLSQCLENAVAKGHCLLLYASLQKSKKQCLSISDEATLLSSSLIDWLRHLEMSERSEPKLPLMLREVCTLSLRQLACNVSQPLVAKMLLDFSDTLSLLHSQSWSLLGALGFSPKYNPPPRAKFLALSLNYFLHTCVLEGPTVKTRSLSAEERGKLKCINMDKVAEMEKDLTAMLNKQAFFGLIDNIEWVLKVAQDPSTSLEDLESFFSVLICDNLYTETYLR